MKKAQASRPTLSAVICGAGSAARMDGMDKQMITIEGIPVLIKSIQAFEASNLVDEIVVVTRRQEILHVAQLIKQYGIMKVTNIVCGGKTRQQSVIAGMHSVKRTTDFIAVHDGARPLIETDVIDGCIQMAYEKNCVVVGVKVKDTIKTVGSKGQITSTPDRECLYAVQTPQIFRFDIYDRAVQNAEENNLDFTDDAQMVEQIGETVYMAPGDYTNIKLTTPEDIYLAQAVISQRFADTFGQKKGW